MAHHAPGRPSRQCLTLLPSATHATKCATCRQFTNLIFQSNQLGLAGQWAKIKKAYAAANRLLGDIPKVTPSSKVVGDLAQVRETRGLLACRPELLKSSAVSVI